MASGVIDAGKTTLSRRGRIGSAVVPSISPPGTRSSTALISVSPPLTGTRTGPGLRCLSGSVIVRRPPLVLRLGCVGVEPLAEDDAALEGAVVDLDVLVAAAVAERALAPARR